MGGETPATSKPARSRLRRVARALFRCARTGLVAFILVVALLGLFLNKVGLPGFIKQQLIAQARANGLEVEFSRLRLRWHRGIVAEDLTINGTNTLSGPQLFVEEAHCPLRPAALWGLQLRMNSLGLRDGRLIWPLPPEDGRRRTFALNDVNGQLLFRRDGQWELQSLHAVYHGINLELNGVLANASKLREWRVPKGPEQRPGSADIFLRRVENLMEQVKAINNSEVRLKFEADAQDPSTFSAYLFGRLPSLESPWGKAGDVTLVGQILPPGPTNVTGLARLRLSADRTFGAWGRAQSLRFLSEMAPPFQTTNKPSADASRPLAKAEPIALAKSLTFLLPTNMAVNIEVAGLETSWGAAERLLFSAHSAVCATNSALAVSEFTATADNLRTRWAQANHAQLTADASHPMTNWLPSNISSQIRLDAPETPWGAAQRGEWSLSAVLPAPGQLQLFRTNIPFQARLENIAGKAIGVFDHPHLQDVKAESLTLNLELGPSQVQFEASGKASNGDFRLGASFVPSNGVVSFNTSGKLDPHLFATFLSTNTQQALAYYSFETPPSLEATGSFLLPPWTNMPPDWAGEILPTLFLNGTFAAGAGAYRGVVFTSVQSPFAFTNLLWRFPALRLESPDGNLEADYTSNPATRDFHVRIESHVQARAVKPLFEKESERRALDFFQFTTPPHIQGEVWGRWGDIDSLGAVAQVTATNLSFRGEPVKDFLTHLRYTNKVFAFTDSQLRREGGESGFAPGITLDLERLKLFFTNCFSTLNPYAVARVITKPAIAAISPYQYEAPPTVRVNGAIDLKRKRYEEDIHFEISGNRFHWQQFQLEQLMGRIDWVGQTLAVTNAVGSTKTGKIAGHTRFDFTGPGDPNFIFRVDSDKIDLREIARALSGRTNKLEGLLSGQLVVTQANLADSKTWQGFGRLNLQDGLLWDIPMFGLLSPVLNGFVPGLGNSRANEAEATFVLTNGVFYSKDLEIHATMMRMRFKGAVGLNRHVDARIEAELLRDVPGVGIVISKVFWPVTKLLEYKITGTLQEPKAEPLYIIPKVLLMPFHPFKTFKEFFLPQMQKDSPEKQPQNP